MPLLWEIPNLLELQMLAVGFFYGFPQRLWYYTMLKFSRLITLKYILHETDNMCTIRAHVGPDRMLHRLKDIIPDTRHIKQGCVISLLFLDSISLRRCPIWTNRRHDLPGAPIQCVLYVDDLLLVWVSHPRLQQHLNSKETHDTWEVRANMVKVKLWSSTKPPPNITIGLIGTGMMMFNYILGKPVAF